MPTRTRVCVKAQPSGRRSHQRPMGDVATWRGDRCRGSPETLMRVSRIFLGGVILHLRFRKIFGGGARRLGVNYLVR